MLDWILYDAEDQVEESCTGSFYDEESNSRSKRSRQVKTRRRRDSDRTVESYGDESSGYSSRDSEEQTMGRIQRQARKLTQRILRKEKNLQRQNTDYDADESTAGNIDSCGSDVCSAVGSGSGVPSSATSGASYYFQALNDRSRSRPLFDEESAASVYSPANEEGGKTVDSMEATQSKLEREEVRKKSKILWITKHFNDVEALEEQKQEGDEPNISAEKLEELKKVAKEQETKRIRTFTIIAIPMLILGMAGLGVFLGMTWEDDTTPNKKVGSNSGVNFGLQSPTIEFRPSDGDDAYFVGNAESLPWLDEDPSGEIGETLPPVDEDLLQKHLDAYEQWKANNAFIDDDDDNYRSVDIDFDAETISFRNANGNE